MARQIAHRVTTHCAWQTPDYKAWVTIKVRCSNPNDVGFHLYRERDIGVCLAWARSFEAFLANVGRWPSALYLIGRIDNDGDFEPGNARWMTRQERGCIR